MLSTPLSSPPPPSPCFLFSFSSYVYPRDLHSFPTRRSSDLQVVADRRLDDEAVQGGAKHGVVVEAVDQARVKAGLVGLQAVDHDLVQLGGADASDHAGVQDVVAVVDIVLVRDRARLVGASQDMLADL